jgi:hypothetical protein
MIKLLLARSSRNASNKLAAVRSERDAYVRVIWNQTINYWTWWHDRTIAVDYWGGSGPGVEYARGSTPDSDARSNSGPACGGGHSFDPLASYFEPSAGHTTETFGWSAAASYERPLSPQHKKKRTTVTILYIIYYCIRCSTSIYYCAV